ncbi:MAG: Gfo/Idh/MocA family oxidoreductase [Lentisphaerae bacterium]|nr:Gfo/Idh/MocA family oxidoreductase [Lentisphaerota bacterium]
MAMIKLGIVGTGGMANAHARSFKEIKGVAVTACQDVLAERAQAFAKKWDIPHVAASLDELIDQVDAVTVVTPDRHHAAPSLAVLRAGKHLMCEKPLTVTLAEARKVAQAATAAHRRQGTQHLVNFSYRNSSAFQEALSLVRQGVLGDIRHVHSHYLQSWLSAAIWGGWTSEAMLWRLQTAKGSGGVLGDLGCHILDFTTAIAGELESVRCTFATFPKMDAKGRKVTKWKGVPLDANDTAMIELHFGNGAVGQCHTTRWATGHANTVALAVHGTEGALRINLDDGYDKLNLCLGKNRHATKWETRLIKPTPNNYQRLINAIRSGKPEQADLMRGAQIQAYLDACERSAASGGKTTTVRSWK